MDVVVVADPESVGHRAAGLVLERVGRDPSLVLGVATGSSPVSTYRSLIGARRRGTDFSQVRCVALDEYVGIPESDARSYHAFVRREIAEPLGIPGDHLLVPDGNAPDLDAACTSFEATIRAWGGVGLQLLGIGRNGHVGFNEPGSALDSRTRVTALSETTRADNARFFPRPEDVPTYSLTQGVGTIAEARTIVLVASGAHKAAAVRAAVEEPVTEACPASFLQRHPDATMILDPEAAAGLTGRADQGASESTRAR